MRASDEARPAGPGRLLAHPVDGLRGDPEPHLPAGGVELGPEPPGLPVGLPARRARHQEPGPAGPVVAPPLDDDGQAVVGHVHAGQLSAIRAFIGKDSGRRVGAAPAPAAVARTDGRRRRALGGQRSPAGFEETAAANSRAAARCSGVSRSAAPRRSISWARSSGGVPAGATSAAGGRRSVSSVFVFGMGSRVLPEMILDPRIPDSPTRSIASRG